MPPKSSDGIDRKNKPPYFRRLVFLFLIVIFFENIFILFAPFLHLFFINLIQIFDLYINLIKYHMTLHRGKDDSGFLFEFVCLSVNHDLGRYWV